MAVNQTEQKLRSELRRKKSDLQNAISNANVQKRLAESTAESATKRAAARTKYETLQKQVSSLKEIVSNLEKDVKREQSRKEVDEVRVNYQRLKDEYNLLIDKTTPEAQELADRVNKEVGKLNSAYIKGGFSTRVETIKKPGTSQKTTVSTAGPTGATTLQATKTAEETAKKETAAEKKAKATGAATQGAMPTMPSGGKTGTAGPGFNPAVVRAGEEGGTANIPAKSERDLATILQKTEFWFDLPDYIFKTVPDLGKLLVQAVNEEWDEDKFLSKAKLTTWWQQNSAPIRTRIISRAKFNELTAAGQDASKTEYAMDTANIKRNIQTRARRMGANLDENAVNQIASRIYDGFLENDTVAIDSFIAPYIGKVTSIVGNGLGIQPTGYTGQALQNYQALQAVAKSNGLTIKDILPRLSVLPGQNLDDVVLQKLATGELDINRLAQDARMIAAQGSPDYVKNLLQQGYDLEQIYAPYKNVMGQILELNPDEIDLNDGTLRSAIGTDKEMNIYDFKKALRKDSRWQYTENAREEVANSVLGVLRDFGFQG